MKRQSTTVAVCGVLVALTFILGWIPVGGPFLLPTLFAACCFTLGISFFASTMFGVVSLLICYIVGPTNPVGWYFITYPWLPIVGRMFIGPLVYAVCRLLHKLIKPEKKLGKTVPIAVSAAIGSLSNTVFVGGFMLLLDSSKMPTDLTLSFFGLMDFKDVTFVFLALMGAIEIVVNALLLPPIVLAVKKAAPKLFAEINMKKMKNDGKV